MYPQTNRQVERCVQTVKRMIKKCIMDIQDINIALLNNRNAIFHELDASPAHMLMSRTLRSHLPKIESKLKPKVVMNMKPKIKKRQALQKHYFDRRGVVTHQTLKQGDQIRYREHNRAWVKCIITNTNIPGPWDYEITNKESNVIRWNRKHIIKCPQDQQKETNVTITTTKAPTKNTAQTGYVTRYGQVSKPVGRYGAIYAVKKHEDVENK